MNFKKIIWQWYIQIQIQHQKCKPSLQWISVSKGVFKLRWVWESHQNAAVCCSFSSWVMPSKLFWIMHRPGWGTQNSYKGFGSENPRSWSIVWGHLSNASKMMKADSCQDWRAPRAFKSRWIVASELPCTQPMGHSHAGVCSSSLGAPTLLPLQDWQQQSCLASCLQSLDELAEFAGQFSHTW